MNEIQDMDIWFLPFGLVSYPSSVHPKGMIFAAILAPIVLATTVTFQLASHERACFYAMTKEKSEKIAFYFAVRPLTTGAGWRRL